MPTIRSGVGFGHATRFAIGLVQSVMGLFAAGTLFFEAHQLFLWYYSREWQGIQTGGINGCQGEETIVNGDLFDAKTFCNQPENLVPWFEVYKHHPFATVAYYGTIVAVLIAIGLLWWLHRKRAAPVDPTVQQPHGGSADTDTI